MNDGFALRDTVAGIALRRAGGYLINWFIYGLAVALTILVLLVVYVIPSVALVAVYPLWACAGRAWTGRWPSLAEGLRDIWKEW